MSTRSALGTVVTVLIAFFILSIILSQLFGFPSPISFVATDSMKPQLAPGDGFIGVPEPVAGDISEGDVVTYRAQELQGGGLTTHRIVGETENGYITKGDNNPFTDQEGAEPPVTEPQIELVVLQFNGRILKIPFVGTVAQGINAGLAGIVGLVGVSGLSATNPGVIIGVTGLGLLALSSIYDVATADNTRPVSRAVSRPAAVDSRLVLAVILLIVSLPVVSMTTLPGGTDQMRIVSTTRPHPDDQSRIQAGSTAEHTMSIKNNQRVPMVILVTGATDGFTVQQNEFVLAAGETADTEYRMTAPTKPGGYVHARSVSFYLPVLPVAAIKTLHDIHPLLALGSTTGSILLPIILLFYSVIGFRSIRLREASR